MSEKYCGECACEMESDANKCPRCGACSSFAAPAGSANECIKRGVSELLLGAISGQIARYRTEEGYIRWGLVEREIHELIDRQLPDSPNEKLRHSAPAEDSNNTKNV